MILGLSQASGFLTGGPFKIQVRIEDVISEFQFDEDDLELFLVKHPELYTGVITLNVDPKRLTIEKLMLGQKEYKTATDFIQGYKAQKNNVPHFQKLYKTFGKDVFRIKYWDCKNEVLCDDAGITSCVAKKPSPGDIIFANGNNVLFQDSYLTDLVNRIINGESLKIIHAGLDYKDPPEFITNVEIYNAVSINPLTRMIIEYFASASLTDKNLIALLKSAIFRLLAESNSSNPFGFVFSKFGESLISCIAFDEVWTKVEDTIIEYKPQDYFQGSERDIIQRFVEDLKAKFKGNHAKVYFIGVEDNGQINLMLADRAKSDRLGKIEKALKDEFKVNSLYLYPIIKGRKALVVLVAFRG